MGATRTCATSVRRCASSSSGTLAVAPTPTWAVPRRVASTAVDASAERIPSSVCATRERPDPRREYVHQGAGAGGQHDARVLALASEARLERCGALHGVSRECGELDPLARQDEAAPARW